jgi:AcrR family transcriptional regulator
MRRGSARQPALSTRDRILHAAILRFSSHSYEETGLRDIAADARAVGPTMAGLQPTTQRITRGDTRVSRVAL